MIIDVKNDILMKSFGANIGANLCGGEIIELVGDVGAGKTTLTKGIAVGLGIDENIQSPSFTINRVYDGRDNLILSHYDFYRLSDAGIMADELREVINNSNTVTVIEWAGAVSGILPDDRITIHIGTKSENERELTLSFGGEKSKKVLEGIS
jgi:tRNA threonylcarbamoyladenosine biosynthesis protein TsaE